MNPSLNCFRLTDFYHNNENLIILNHYTIIYFTRGKGNLLIDFKKHFYEKDSMFLLSKGQLLDYSLTKDDDGFIIEIPQRILLEINKSTPFLNQNILFNHWLIPPKVNTEKENFYGLILNFYKEIKHSNSDIDITIAKQSLKNILLKSYKTYNTKESQVYFNKFKLLVDKHIKLTRNTQDYADWLGISYKHLNNICKKSISHTAKDFIINTTTLNIKRYEKTGVTTNELSRILGFNEPTNFVKFRKKHS